MQRNRQHAADLGARAFDVRHHAGGRQRDTPLGNADAFAVRHDQDGVAHGLEIIQRLAHAHHDDIGDAALAARDDAVGRPRAARPVAEPVAGRQHLAGDFAGGEIAHQALRAGMAERAG